MNKELKLIRKTIREQNENINKETGTVKKEPNKYCGAEKYNN